MWQFVKGTGLRYGLTVDSYVDERRDPEKSTRATRPSTCWTSINSSAPGIWRTPPTTAVKEECSGSWTGDHKNFWELSANMCLPTETKNYVPQMIAATIIAKNPEKFGFGKISLSSLR